MEICQTLEVKEYVVNLAKSAWDGGQLIDEVSTTTGEKEMATHSSILAWEIPRTEESGRL